MVVFGKLVRKEIGVKDEIIKIWNRYYVGELLWKERIYSIERIRLCLSLSLLGFLLLYLSNK